MSNSSSSGGSGYNHNINNNNSTNNNSHAPSLSSTNSGSHRRLSYAIVAAGRQQSSRPTSTLTSRTTSASNSRDHLDQSSPSMDLDGGVSTGGAAAHTRRTSNPAWAGEPRRRYGSAGALGHEDNSHPPFFTPSYLRHSRHVQRVERRYEEHVAQLRESALRSQGTRPPAASNNSSSTNVYRLPPSQPHRQPALQDVLERITPATDDPDALHPLPSSWNEEDRQASIEVLGSTEIRFQGAAKDKDSAASIRTDYPIPRECGMFYYEVTILSRAKESSVGIGVCGRGVDLNRPPGWELDSWGYHGDDGAVYETSSNGKPYGPQFGSQDVIGCGVSFRKNEIFFTRNGQYLGAAVSRLKTSQNLYPSIGMRRPGDHVRANFGKAPFVFNIDRKMAREREEVAAEIGKIDVSHLHPPDDENTLIEKLIAQYLTHEGFVETSKAFAQDVQSRYQSTEAQPQPFPLNTEQDDVNAINRQKIRKNILDGEIDHALKLINSLFPHVFHQPQNKDILFRLRCRKFIEMMRRHSELARLGSRPSVTAKAAADLVNVHQGESDNDSLYDDATDTQMELDDQLHRETSKTQDLPPTAATGDDVDMDSSQELGSSLKWWLMKPADLMATAVAYGSELQGLYGSDKQPDVQRHLREIFALVAYGDINQSPLGHLADEKGRVGIAEDVNGAILVSLGKPSSAALERMCAMTETLLLETSTRAGNSAAFVNVRDLLRP